MSDTWEKAILRTIKSHHGEAELQQIYKDIHRYKDLTEEDLRQTEYGGRPAYQHSIRYMVSDLTQRGILKRTGRGVYALTDIGQILVN